MSVHRHPMRRMPLAPIVQPASHDVPAKDAQAEPLMPALAPSMPTVKKRKKLLEVTPGQGDEPRHE